MKELSIEEKAQAYDKAVKIAKSKIENDKDHVLYEDDITEIFPELQDNKDERIRKELISYITQINYDNSHTWNGINLNVFIDWLEKQGKNNMGISEAAKQKLEDNLNNALEKETPESWNKFLDKLCEQNPVNIDYISGIRKELLRIVDNADINIFTKSQWEAIRAAHRLLGEYIAEMQKPAWSEEDEIEFTHILKTLKTVSEEQQAKGYNNLISSVNWLKSLKDRIQSQSQWNPSDEDKLRVKQAIMYLSKKLSFESEKDDYNFREGQIKWLKSLKERYSSL